MVQLRELRAIQGNLAKAAKDKGLLKETLKDFFADYLRQGERKLQKKLRTAAVSEHFTDTIASKRLYKAFNTNLDEALKIGSDGSLRFAFSIKSNGAAKRALAPDPMRYYAAIDENTRDGGPSVDRVIEWMKERGIVQKLKNGKGFRKTLDTKGGKKPTVRQVAYLIMRSIRRKTAAKQYKALKLTEMFVSIIDIKNPESNFRDTMRKRVSNLVVGKTARFR